MSASIAESLGVKHDLVRLERDKKDKKKWRSPSSNNMVSLEESVFGHYQNLGWTGCFYEGATLKFLLKCASVKVCDKLIHHDVSRYVEAIYEIEKRGNPTYRDNVLAESDARLLAKFGEKRYKQMLEMREKSKNFEMPKNISSGISFDEDDSQINNKHKKLFDSRIKEREQALEKMKHTNVSFRQSSSEAYGNLVENVKNTTENKIKSVLEVCEYPLRDYDNLDKANVISLFRVLKKANLAKIAEKFSENPYEYRRGWPDLTLWKGNKLVFYEIKGPNDRIAQSQKTIIREFFHGMKLSFDYFLVTVEEK